MSESRENLRSVLLIVANHAITGDLNLGGQRLSDLLNDGRSSLIDLHNASFSHIGEPGKVINRAERTSVPKDKVKIAFELSAERIANTQRVFKYREKRKYPVLLATGDIEVRGFLHASPTEPPPDLSLMHERSFIPLTKASVNFCVIKNSDFRQDAILVNLRHVQYFSAGNPVDESK